MGVKTLTGERHVKSIDKGGGVIYLKKGADPMPANQKYSTRIHSRRQLGRAKEHLTEVSKVLNEVGCRYADAAPQFADACVKVNDIVDMIQVLIEDMRTNI